MAGIGVVAAPAVVLGIGGYWFLNKRNANKLAEAKEAVLQEALRKRDAVLRELKATNTENQGRIEYLNRLTAQLVAAIDNLGADIQLAKAT